MMTTMMMMMYCGQLKAWSGLMKSSHHPTTLKTLSIYFCSTTQSSDLAAAAHTRSRSTRSSTVLTGKVC